MNKFDKEKYRIDFPESGDLNWKKVKLNTPDNPYFDKKEILGVVLHDENFIVNGVLFTKEQYVIIDNDPISSFWEDNFTPLQMWVNDISPRKGVIGKYDMVNSIYEKL